MRSYISSEVFLAEIPLKSPRKISIFIIYKNIFWIKVSKKRFYLILKKKLAVYQARVRSSQAGTATLALGVDYDSLVSQVALGDANAHVDAVVNII